MSRQKVVVTGLGVVVPHGDDIDEVYQRLHDNAISGRAVLVP